MRNIFAVLNLSPQRQRQKTLETIVALLLEQAEQQPVLFILEDLHWTDPTTLELLNLLIDQTPTASLLTRADLPSDIPTMPGHHRSYLTEITVHSLISRPGRTDCHRHDRWQNLPSSRAPASHEQDGWRPVICRGNDESDS